MTWEGMVSMGFFSITTSGFLTSYIIALGANNLQIGVVAAIPFLAQIIQIPAILLVEKFRRRKAIAVSTWALAQFLWIPVALIPFIHTTPSVLAISTLIALMTLRGLFAAVTACSWSSWSRDLVPQEILGRFYSKQQALATAVAILFSLSSAFFLDYWRSSVPPEKTIFGYTYILFFGAVFLGLASPVLMSFIPEPLMPSGKLTSLWRVITPPFHNANFRKLMGFLLAWGLASNLAIPFFTVYMLQRLNISIGTIIIFSVLSQLSNILFLRLWGPLTDKFGSKAILSVCASLQLLIIFIWIFTSVPESFTLTLALLVGLHIFSGAATAGVSLTVGILGFKLAPGDQATSYLTGASLATSLGSGLGPLLGGVFSDFFGARRMALDFSWTDPVQTLKIGVLHLTGLDFLFAISFILGFMTLNTLASLNEEGSNASRERVMEEIMAESRASFPAIGSIPAVNILKFSPVNYLRRMPGVDVAIGLTAYQLADIAGLMTKTAHRLIKNPLIKINIAREIERGLSRLLPAGEREAQGHSIEIAQDAATGVSQIIGIRTKETGRLIRSAVVGIARTLNRAHADLYQSLYGIGYGVAKGASIGGVGPDELAPDVIAGARAAAKSMGLQEEKAISQAAQGILDATAQMNPEKLEKTKHILTSITEQVPEPNNDKG